MDPFTQIQADPTGTRTERTMQWFVAPRDQEVDIEIELTDRQHMADKLDGKNETPFSFS